MKREIIEFTPWKSSLSRRAPAAICVHLRLSAVKKFPIAVQTPRRAQLCLIVA